MYWTKETDPFHLLSFPLTRVCTKKTDIILFDGGLPSEACVSPVGRSNNCGSMRTRGSSIVLLLAVELLQRLELLDQGLVLVLQHGHSVLQALDVLLLLAPALAGRLSVFL